MFGALRVCRKIQGGVYIHPGESRKIFENLVLGHAASEIFMDVVYRDAGAFDTRFTVADGRIYANAVFKHG